MHILYLHQYFATPDGATGTRSYEFARRWVRAGHNVTVITGHYDIGGLKYTKEPQLIDGIKIFISGAKYSNKMSFLKRITVFISFIFSAFVRGLRQKNVDVVLATSTPLTIGIPAVLLKWVKNRPFVFEVRDQWPEIPIEMGIIRNKLLIKLLLWLEKTIYKNASAIIALSPGMAEGIKAVLGKVEKPVAVIPNSCDIEVFSPDIDGSDIRKRKGWQNKFMLLHTGAIGKANGLDFLIDAAQKLKDNKDINFVIIGDGSEKQRLAETAEKLKLGNVEFLESVSKRDLPKYIAAADVSLVIFANYPVLEHNSANKFFDSLAAGKPILLNYSGWQRKILEGHQAGFGCEQGDLQKFCDNILYLYNARQSLENMGMNSRQLAVNMFNRDALAEKVLEILKSFKK